MSSKRIDELTTRVVVNTDLLPPTPSGGPSGSATVAEVVKAGLSQPNSGVAGAGADLTIKAADGVTSGKGGSITITPGEQATTGGPGKVVIDTLTVGRGASGLSQNTALGLDALAAVTSGNQNVAVGYSVGKSITTGVLSVGVGCSALQNNTTGNSNTAVGFAAMKDTPAGYANSCFGRAAGYAINSSGNTFIGAFSGNNTLTGGDNTAIGYNSAVSNTTGSGLIAVGHSAAQYQADGSTSLTASTNSIYIGYKVRGFNNSDSNSIVIGYQSIGEGANTSVLGNSSTTQTHLYGATQVIGSGAAVTIIPSQRTTSGAGNDVTIKATDGVTSGAGGNIILQPGAQATTGGNGEIKVASADGTKTISLLHDGTNGYLKSNNGSLYLRPSVGAGLRIEDGGILSSDSAVISSPRSFYIGNILLFSSGVIRTNSSGRFGFGYSTASESPSDTGISRGKAQVINLDGGDNNPTYSSTLSSVPVSPAQITADTNNYNPGTARFYRLNTDASRNITGLGISQIDGQECEIWNVGANDIVLKNENANSTAANRFICTGAADIALAPDEIALLRYDATTSRWRVRRVESLATYAANTAIISSSQNDYVLNRSNFQRLNCSVASDITGIAPPTGGAHVDGRMIKIFNVGTANLTFKHNSTSSTAANRMYAASGADIVLGTNDYIECVYDSTDNGSGAAGWRIA